MSKRLDEAKAKFQELNARRAGLSTQSPDVASAVESARADFEAAVRFSEDPNIPAGDTVRDIHAGKAEEALKRYQEALDTQ